MVHSPSFQQFPDPRVFPQPAAVAGEVWWQLAAISLSTSIGVEQEKADDAIRSGVREAMAAGAGERLRHAIVAAPSVAIARHMWRRIAEVFEAWGLEEGAVSLRSFALPLVVVASAERELRLPVVLRDTEQLAGLLVQHGALGGAQNFALSNGLAANEALELPAVLRWLDWQNLSDSAAGEAPEQWLPKRVPAAALNIPGPQESVFLRHLVGVVLAGARTPLFAARDTGKWGMALTQELVQQLAVPGVTLLPLPRPPQSPLVAVVTGRQLQREISFQLFATNAIRKLRASVGEPTAVISAHRIGAADGEVRISLSSPFEPKEAEGFRWPLEPLDRVGDVLAAACDLLRDCQVTDVRILAPVYPDLEPATGMTLLFKPESIGSVEPLAVH